MTDLSKYPRTVFWSADDGGFIAIAPDLPGSSAFGDTQAEALAELDQAMAAWIQAAEAAGNPIPAPSRPGEVQEYSGKVLLRMPKSLHRELAETAKQEGVSLNVQIVADLKGAQEARVARSCGYFAGSTRLHALIFPQAVVGGVVAKSVPEVTQSATGWRLVQTGVATTIRSQDRIHYDG